MKLPWKTSREIEKLEQRIDELEEDLEQERKEKEKYRERFEAEKERRSKLSRKKQEAEKELKKIKQRGKEQQESDEDEADEMSSEELSASRLVKILEKLRSHNSPEKDLVTIYASGKLSDLYDLKGLKNSVTKSEYNFLQDSSFVAFIDPDLFGIKLKSRPVFSDQWNVTEDFRTDALREFIEEEKEWAVVSADRAVLVKEKSGKIIEREEIGSRVDRKQKKGGFSQGRFERKREEQIQEHLKQIEEKVSSETLLVGEERLCKKLPGRYFGGFDDNRDLAGALYGFQMETMS